jgi:hypothetical protein
MLSDERETHPPDPSDVDFIPGVDAVPEQVVVIEEAGDMGLGFTQEPQSHSRI